ncbi:MAG: branched-chain amino acid transport system substrate-binding protein [Candidatus Latescibacterota bacterium]
MNYRYLVISVCAALLLSVPLRAEDGGEVLKIYIDADFTVAKESAVSIEQGLKTALNEVGGVLLGRTVEVVRKDHRGSSPRSKRHLEQYLQDDRALAIFSGLHSPPLLAHRDFINREEILVLDPWAAAGPITRYPSSDNWIFRLSIDDTKAGRVIVRHAVEKRGFEKPYLLLEDTGWGKSNELTMGRMLNEMGVAPVGTEWFNWNLKRARARAIIREVSAVGADVILLVANVEEAKTLLREMVDLGVDIPICSHWGITGGNFTESVSAATRAQVDLSFIQTNFSFIGLAAGAWENEVLTSAKALFPGVITRAEDIGAPAGFVHAYDLGKIFIHAVEQAGLTGDITTDRRTIRKALEQIDRPIRGLIKTYEKPFHPFSVEQPDAHEALSEADFVMGYYGSNNEIILHMDALGE